MKTSIRLALTSLAVSCITLAAAGAPLPFLNSPGDQPASALTQTSVPFDASLAGYAPTEGTLNLVR